MRSPRRKTTGWRWTNPPFSSALVEALAGLSHHILVAFSTGASSTGVYLRAVVEAYMGGASFPLAQTGLILYSGDGLVDLGVLPLPPGGYDTDGGNIALSIKAFRPAGAVTMAVDFVQLTPAGDGLFQRVRQIDFSAAVGDSLVLDGIEDTRLFGRWQRPTYADCAQTHAALAAVPRPAQSDQVAVQRSERRYPPIRAGRKVRVTAFYRRA